MDEIKRAAQAISNADALLLGVSNGLSIAEGYNIFADNEMFRRQFGEFQARYGISCVLEGIFYRYPTQEARAEFFKTLIRYWIDDYKPSQVMKNLLNVVGKMDYFIITSNGDTHLELSGFAPEKVFEIEGTFFNSAENTPIVDKGAQLHAFIETYAPKKLVFMEIGIGSRNTLIKKPMMEAAAQMPNAEYIIFNLSREIFVPDYLQSKAIPVAGDLEKTLTALENHIQNPN